MKKMSTFVVLAVCAAAIISGCSKPMGTTPAEKRDSVLEMRKMTIGELYEKKPEAKAKIRNAAGYGVFSNTNINVLLVSSGHGYGVVRDQSTGKDTYMKMGMVGVGLGAGVKDFRAVIIFKTNEALNTFTEKGWEWGGHADAAAKAGEKGKEAIG